MFYLIGFLGFIVGLVSYHVVYSYLVLLQSVDDYCKPIVEETSAEEKLADRLIESLQTSPDDWSIYISSIIKNKSMNWEIYFSRHTVKFNDIEVFNGRDVIRLEEACREFTKQKIMTNV